MAMDIHTSLRLIARFKWLLITIGILSVAGVAYFVYQNNVPINLNTVNLSTANDSVKAKASKQMSISVTNLPAIVTGPQASDLENQLANLLRQAYGTQADSLTAQTRQSSGSYDQDSFYQFYVDIPNEDISYAITINPKSSNTDVACAIQSMQMDPDSSRCPTAPGVDNYYFPKG